MTSPLDEKYVTSARIPRAGYSTAASLIALLAYTQPLHAAADPDMAARPECSDEAGAACQAAGPISVEPLGPQASSGGEIVVSARLREDRLIDVPVAITALSAEELDAVGSLDLTRVAELVPSAVIARGSSGNGGLISIRGVASSPINAAFESSVGINIDGITITRGYITQMQFFDLDQIEVLKGPQALFFGKNSPAGVISIHTAGPGPVWDGYIKGGYEFVADEQFVEGAVGGPVTDTLGVRLALRFAEMEGYFYNQARPIANPFDPASPLPGAVGNRRGPGSSNFTARLTTEFEPIEELRLIAKINYQKFKDNELTSSSQAISCSAGRSNTTTLGVQDPFSDCRADAFRSSGFLSPLTYDNYDILTEEGQPFARNTMWLASLRADYDLGPLTITSLSGFFDLRQVGWGNYSFDVYPRFSGINGENDRIYTQELRLNTDLDGIFDFAAGAFYEDSYRQAFGRSRSVGMQGPDPVTGSDVTNSPQSTAYTTTKSAFGQIIVAPVPAIEATAGVRYTDIQQNVDIRNIFVNQFRVPGAPNIQAFAFRPVGDALTGDYSDDNWSPELTLRFKPSPNQTLYAAYKTGYKTGGISTTVVILRSDTIPRLTFDSEKASGGEVGYKASLFNGALDLNVDAYYYKYKDLQRTTLDIATTAFLVRNAASATVKGVEFQGSYRLSDRLSFDLAGAYNHATYNDFAGAACYNGQTVAQGCVNVPGTAASAQDLSGATLSRAPRLVGNARVSYDAPLSNLLGFELSAGANYSSSYFLLDDNDPRGIQGRYLKANVSARLYTLDEKFELAFAIRNLTNKYVALVGSAKPGGSSGDLIGVIDRGRQFLLSGTVNF